MFEKKYKIKNLHVVRLGRIKHNSEGKKIIYYFEEPYVIVKNYLHSDYIDDEKPLYISTDDTLTITGFHDAATPDCQYISGGIYCLTPPAIRTLHGCMEKGMARMRNFQRQLVADGLKLKAYPFKKIVDVDHAEDIVKAEAFLNGEG